MLKNIYGAVDKEWSDYPVFKGILGPYQATTKVELLDATDPKSYQKEGLFVISNKLISNYILENAENLMNFDALYTQKLNELLLRFEKNGKECFVISNHHIIDKICQEKMEAGVWPTNMKTAFVFKSKKEMAQFFNLNIPQESWKNNFFGLLSDTPGVYYSAEEYTKKTVHKKLNP